MTDSRLSVALFAALGCLAGSGCSKPTPVPAADPGAGSPVALVAFEDAAAPAQGAAKPGQLTPNAQEESALPSEPDVDWATHFRKRMAIYCDTANGAALVLGRHERTASFDQQCSMLKGLLKHARSADEDDQFDAATRHGDQILMQLKLGHLYLRQRDELDGMRSPGAVKLLRDTYQACSQLAREVQQEIDDLRREVEAK